MLRRALQYSSVTGLKLSLHEEDLTLTAGAQMHEGAVSAELGLHGYPGIGESVMVARDLQIARFEGAPACISATLRGRIGGRDPGAPRSSAST